MPDTATYERYRQLYVDFQTAIEHHDPEKDSRYHFKEYLKFQENEGLTRGKGDPARGQDPAMNYPYPAVEGGGSTDIGYGHKLKAGESFPRGQTDAQVGQMLESDMTEHQGIARTRYNRRGQGFDKLSKSGQALLTDYSFLGMGQGHTGGETELSKKIRAGLSDADVLLEARNYTGASTRRTTGRKDMYQNIINHEKGDLAIKKAFLTMEAYLNFTVEEILETNFPGLYSKKQIKIARVAEPRDRITGADFRKLRQGKRRRNG